MYAERHQVTVTTDASGDGTGYTPVLTGQILAIIYTKPGSGNYANGVDFAITLESTGQNLWTESNVNASKTVSPRQATHGADGVAALYAAGGSAVLGPIVAAQERVRVVVAQGGDTKVGTFTVVVA